MSTKKLLDREVSRAKSWLTNCEGQAATLQRRLSAAIQQGECGLDNIRFQLAVAERLKAEALDDLIGWRNMQRRTR
jgi:hypothetical protein